MLEKRTQGSADGVEDGATLDDSSNDEKDEEENSKSSEDSKEDDDDHLGNDDEDEEEELDDAENHQNMVHVQTRLGQMIKAPQCLIAEIGALLAPEERLIETLNVLGGFDQGEIGCVWAGIGGGFDDTNELHVMNYKKAMSALDRAKWDKAVAEEHARMVEHRVWMAVKASTMPKGSKIIDTTWAMKKKSNGMHRARINARGFRQIDGEHYDSSSISAPVVNDTTIHNSFALMLMMGGTGKLVDVKGAFLHGTFEDGEKIYLTVPEGSEQYYPDGTLLELNKPIYGLKQSAMAFWHELLKCMNNMGYKRSSSDPCLYYCYVNGQVNIWLSWINDCLNVGMELLVMKVIPEMKLHFDCDELRSLSEYFGCKLDYKMG